MEWFSCAGLPDAIQLMCESILSKISNIIRAGCVINL